MEPPCLKPGHKYYFGHNGDVSRFIESGDAKVVHFAFDPQWYPVEDFGRWMRAPKGRLEFTVEPGRDEAILLLLEASTVPWLTSTGLSISVNGIYYTVPALKAASKFLLLLEASCPDGKLAIDFAPLGKVSAGTDPRKDLFLGLCSLSYARSNDILSRLRMFEELVLSSSNGMRLTPDPIEK